MGDARLRPFSRSSVFRGESALQGAAADPGEVDHGHDHEAGRPDDSPDREPGDRKRLLHAEGAGVLLPAVAEGGLLRDGACHLDGLRVPLGAAVPPGPTELAWSEFHRRLRAFVAPRVRDLADAEDIVQQVFLRMHQNLGRLRSADGVGPWLYRTARNAIADHYRAPTRRHEEAAGDTRETDPRTSRPSDVDEDPMGASCATACLRPMVDRLPEPYRRAIEKVELEGMTQVRASLAEGLSLSGMKARVQRARQRLKAMLLERCRVALDARGALVTCEARDVPGTPCRLPRP